MCLQKIAHQTFQSHFYNNPYPGRGLIIGRSQEEGWYQVYFIMGRSEHSRNRRFVLDGSTLRTEPVDPSKVEDPSLIIYEAMFELNGKFIVSNGDQTKTLYEGLGAGKRFDESLSTREREPDAPNYTPRITGMLEVDAAGERISLNILKGNRIDPENTDRYFYYPSLPEMGLGYGLTTYLGDGSPLPSFSGDPLVLPLEGAAEDILEFYWNALNDENRISIAVKTIAEGGSKSDIILKNKYA